jgi:hypothetical protein
VCIVRLYRVGTPLDTHNGCIKLVVESQDFLYLPTSFNDVYGLVMFSCTVHARFFRPSKRWYAIVTTVGYTEISLLV